MPLCRQVFFRQGLFNNKIPVDTSRDSEMPFLIERYRRGLPSVNSMWIITHNCLSLHATNWQIHIDIIDVLGKMYDMKGINVVVLNFLVLLIRTL